MKVACWLGLAVLTGMAFRMPGQIGTLRMLAIVAVFLAVGMVVLKPF